MNLDQIREKIEKFELLEKDILLKKGNYNRIVDDLDSRKKQLTQFKKDLELFEDTAEFLRKVSTFLREGTKNKIETIVTEALNEIILDKDIEFLMKFDEKRNVNTLEFVVKEGDKELPILDSNGGGVINIIATVLRIIFVELQSSEPTTIILDEPASNLSAQYQSSFGRFLSMLSERLGHQLIIVTHNKTVAEQCHNMIMIEQDKKGISYIKEDKDETL